MESVSVNVAIFGGGATGLWLLNELQQSGYSAVLFETSSLGQGQTVCSQGILHSGLKYMLNGLLNGAARQAREMPLRWKQSLAGKAFPDLTNVKVLASTFHLWGTDSAFSRFGLMGAQLGLQVTPQRLAASEYPAALTECRGPVLSVDEQTIDPRSLIQTLATPYLDRIFQIDPSGPAFGTQRKSTPVGPFVVTSNQGRHQVRIEADQIVLAAGAGNGPLRACFGFEKSEMQLRPLHMVLVKGELPEFHGHCVEGARTRISVTSGRCSDGKVVWQVGGQIAEDGVKRTPAEQLQCARHELAELLPHVSLRDAEWSAYRINRAEGATLTGARPESFRILQDSNLLTVWPTKLVLIPQAVDSILKKMGGLNPKPVLPLTPLQEFPKPGVALPPWDSVQGWSRDSSLVERV